MHLASTSFGRPLAVIALIASLVSTAAPLHAATFRIHVARVPTAPTPSQGVTIWMQSDTAFGETAGVEYQVGTTFTKVLGTFDLSGPAPANWRADIPQLPPGTSVSYQLFTRNQSGGDYGFTGFNWQYSVDSPVSATRTTFGRIKALYR